MRKDKILKITKEEFAKNRDGLLYKIFDEIADLSGATLLNFKFKKFLDGECELTHGYSFSKQRKPKS